MTELMPAPRPEIQEKKRKGKAAGEPGGGYVEIDEEPGRKAAPEKEPQKKEGQPGPEKTA